MGALDRVRRHYDCRPYPPVPAAALPAPGQGEAIALETGRSLAGRPAPHDGSRILVAGCGTFEPALVRAVHPRAREIVAVDLSARALGVLRRRLLLQSAAAALRGRRLPPVRILCGDAGGLSPAHVGRFDLVVATGLLHHHEDPASLLASLARLLAPQGLLRAAVYPAHSRIWIGQTARWLALGGIGPATPRLVRAAARRVAALPPEHPVRRSFELNPDARTAAGVADAYFHPLERPLSFPAWREAARLAHLRLAGETGPPSARSSGLETLVPEASALDAWSKLAVLDDLGALGAMPVLWLAPGREPPASVVPPPAAASPPPDLREGSLQRDGATVLCRGRIRSLLGDEVGRRLLVHTDWLIPSPVRFELAEGLRRAAARVVPFGLHERALLSRVGEKHEHGTGAFPPAAGLLEERDLELPAAPGDDEWRVLEEALRAPGLFRQVGERLLVEGARASWVGPFRPRSLREGTSRDA